MVFLLNLVFHFQIYILLIFIIYKYRLIYFLIRVNSLGFGGFEIVHFLLQCLLPHIFFCDGPADEFIDSHFARRESIKNVECFFLV